MVKSKRQKIIISSIVIVFLILSIASVYYFKKLNSNGEVELVRSRK
jgi:uncharacterized protein YpmB